MTTTVTRPTQETQPFMVEILQHDIQCFLRGPGAPAKLDDCSVDHIKKMIAEGYREGELFVEGESDETPFRGWWAITRNDAGN